MQLKTKGISFWDRKQNNGLMSLSETHTFIVFNVFTFAWYAFNVTSRWWQRNKLVQILLWIYEPLHWKQFRNLPEENYYYYYKTLFICIFISIRLQYFPKMCVSSCVFFFLSIPHKLLVDNVTHSCYERHHFTSPSSVSDNTYQRNAFVPKLSKHCVHNILG